MIILKEFNSTHKINSLKKDLKSKIREVAISEEFGFDDHIEDDQYSDWRELASKSVEDSDGFNTDYTLYTNGETYICMFGDKDLYEPDASYADYETENEQDAWDWFNSYTGFADEEDEDDIYGSEYLESDFNKYEFLVKRYGREEDRETVTAISLKDAEDQLNSDEYVEYWDYLPDFNYDIEASY